MLKVDHLCVQLAGQTVLDDVSFSVKKGTMVGVLGENGSGKTTLMRAMVGDCAVARGTIYMDGHQTHTFSAKQKARKVAVCAQNHLMLPEVTVQEAVTLGRYPYRHGWLSLCSTEDHVTVHQVMTETNVAHLAGRPLAELSGGELQRVWLAQALAQQPSLLLLDEPTNHLDTAQKVAFMDYLHILMRTRQLTIVVILHDVNIASLYCDEVVLLKQGKVLAAGKTDNLLTTTLLEHLYGTKFVEWTVPDVGKKQFVAMPQRISGN